MSYYLSYHSIYFCWIFTIITVASTVVQCNPFNCKQSQHDKELKHRTCWTIDRVQTNMQKLNGLYIKILTVNLRLHIFPDAFDWLQFPRWLFYMQTHLALLKKKKIIYSWIDWIKVIFFFRMYTIQLNVELFTRALHINCIFVGIHNSWKFVTDWALSTCVLFSKSVLIPRISRFVLLMISDNKRWIWNIIHCLSSTMNLKENC